MTNRRAWIGPAQWPLIGITVGDPAGIGPEIAVKAAYTKEVLANCCPLLIGDPVGIEAEAVRQGHRVAPLRVQRGEALPEAPGRPLLLSAFPLEDRVGADRPTAARLRQSSAPCPPVGPIEWGRAQAAGGWAAAAAIETAVELCLAGELAAMATAPINKTSFSLAGLPFPGHTEYLAFLTACEDFAMAFIAPRLRVALLTIHLPLREVPQRIRQAELVRLIHLVARELTSYGIAQPRIAVAGLNPHAGEGGLFGDEEQREMVPAIESCQRDGIAVGGPYPADTIFLRAVRGEFDLVIACYHDQGLIPIKCFSFGEAVNVTFGLPLIRTSVDHGTAFDLAGQGKADASSMRVAIELAAQLARLRRDAGMLQET
jgi:4-hydroxythreonine-4-phosphate dehydrogenase